MSMKKFDILPEKQITVMEIHARTTDPASSPLTAFSVVAFWDSAEENVKVIKRDVKMFGPEKLNIISCGLFSLRFSDCFNKHEHFFLENCNSVGKVISLCNVKDHVQKGHGRVKFYSNLSSLKTRKAISEKTVCLVTEPYQL